MNDPIKMQQSVLTLNSFSVPWLQHGKKESLTNIHFSPANGIPVGSYHSFFKQLEQDFNISGMDSRGAWGGSILPDESMPFEVYADDLVNALEAKYTQPVIGIGHSLGGVITLLAAIKQPELFSKIVLIDPASTPTVFSNTIFKLLPKSMHERWFSFIKGSLQRRRVWESREEFFSHYRGHRTFQRFTDQALADYAQYGLKKRPDGQFELVFSPDWEAFNFRKVRFLWDSLVELKHPTLFIRAEHKSLYAEKTFKRYNRRLGDNVTAFTLEKTSHLMTHEQTELVGSTILEWLNGSRE